MNTVKLLYQTKYGSHLYGTSTPESDVDYKSIVLPSFASLMINKQLRNQVSTTGGSGKNTALDIDHETINLQTFAQDFIKGQTYALEIAFSVLSDNHTDKKIYDKRFVVFVQELTSRFLTSNIKALVGYAVNQANLYSRKGSRYDSILKLTNIVEMYDDQLHYADAPPALSEALAEFSKLHPKHFYLYDDTTSNGYSILAKKLPFNNDMKQWKITIRKMLEKYGSRSKEAQNGVDWKATMHAVRIANQGLSLLTNKQLVFPHTPELVTHLLSIRRGEIDLDDVSNELASIIDNIYVAQTNTELPELTHELKEVFDDWLAKWVMEFYSIKI